MGGGREMEINLPCTPKIRGGVGVTVREYVWYYNNYYLPE